MMKLNINRFGLRFAMVLVLALCAKVANAENKLFVEPLTIDSYSTYNVPVMMDNTDDVATFQFDIILPEGLELDGEPFANQERVVAKYQKLTFNEINNRVMVNSLRQSPIVGHEGAVVYIPIKVAFGASVNKTYDITLAHCNIGNLDGEQLWKGNVTAPITVIPGTVTGTPVAQEMVVNPGETFELPFAFDNNCTISGIQVNVKTPAGFVVEDIKLADRCTPGAYAILGNPAENTTSVILVDDLTNYAVNGQSGVVFTLTINAPETFEGDGTITFADFQVSYLPGQSIYGEGYSVALVNGATAYTKAIAAIDDLKAALTAALATIAEVAPDVKDDFTGADITAKIDALKAAVDAAYADHTLTPDYDAIMAPAEGIRADIEALVPAAEDAQRLFLNAQAYQEALALLESLQQQFNAAKAALAEQYPNADVAAQLAEIENWFAQLKAAADEDYENSKKAGQFVFRDPTPYYQEYMEGVIAEAERQQDNYNNYQEAKAQIAALYEMLDEKVAALKEQYPNCNLDAEVEALKAEFAAEDKAADEAYAAVATEGNFKFDFYMGAYEQKINELSIPAERQQTNYDKYQEALAAIADLQKLLDETITKVATEYPNADVTALATEAQTSINDLTAAVEENYEQNGLNGWFTYQVPTEDFTEGINAIATEAKRQQENYDYYQEAKAQIAALYEMLDEKVAALKEQYPNCNLDAEVEALKAEFAAEDKAADEAYAAVATEGDFKFDFYMGAYEQKINELSIPAERQQTNYNKYQEALAAIADLQKLLDETLANVATEYPNADVTAQATEAQTSINDLTAAVEENYEQNGLNGWFTYEVPTADFTEGINAIATEAARQQDNYNKYQEALAEIADLQAKLDEAKATIAKEYPAANVSDNVDMIQLSIDFLKAAVDESYDSVKEEGTFVFPMSTEDFYAAIEALVPEAKRQADNAAAYNESLKALNDLQNQLNVAVMTAESLYPESDLTKVVANAQKAIDDAKAAAAAANEAVATAGTYEYTVPTEAINADIKAIIVEAKRQADNTAAYEATKAAIEDLQKKYDEAVAEINEKYADAAKLDQVKDALKAIEDAINNASTEAQTAYDAVAEEGKYEYNLDVKGIEKQIADAVALADQLGVEAILIEDLGGDVKFFNIHGVQVKNPAPGTMVIAVGANGQTRKILVK